MFNKEVLYFPHWVAKAMLLEVLCKNSIGEVGDFRDATANAPWRNNIMSRYEFLFMSTTRTRTTMLRPFGSRNALRPENLAGVRLLRPRSSLPGSGVAPAWPGLWRAAPLLLPALAAFWWAGPWGATCLWLFSPSPRSARRPCSSENALPASALPRYHLQPLATLRRMTNLSWPRPSRPLVIRPR